MNPVSDITTESIREEHKMEIVRIATTCVAGFFIEHWTRDDSLDPGWSKPVEVAPASPDSSVPVPCA